MKLLRAIRKDKEMTLRKVADRLNDIEPYRKWKCNQGIISHIELKNNIEIDSLIRLCNLYWAVLNIVYTNQTFICRIMSKISVAQSLKYIRTVMLHESRRHVAERSNDTICGTVIEEVERKWNCHTNTLIKILKLYDMELQIKYMGKTYTQDQFNIETL